MLQHTDSRQQAKWARDKARLCLKFIEINVRGTQGCERQEHMSRAAQIQLPTCLTEWRAGGNKFSHQAVGEPAENGNTSLNSLPEWLVSADSFVEDGSVILVSVPLKNSFVLNWPSKNKDFTVMHLWHCR